MSIPQTAGWAATLFGIIGLAGGLNKGDMLQSIVAFASIVVGFSVATGWSDHGR